MKRLIYVVFSLMTAYPVWGENIPVELPPQSESSRLSKTPETVESPPSQTSDADLPVTLKTETTEEPDAPFRERPYRMWPLYYHRQFAPEHERTIYGPLWLTEQNQGTTLNYPLWPFSGVTRSKGRLGKLDILWPFTKYEQNDGRVSYDLLWPFTGFSYEEAPEREMRSLFLAWPLAGYYHETIHDPGDAAVTGEQTGYMPLYFSSKNGNESFHYIFPSYLTGSNPDKETSFHTLLPLYFSAERPDGSSLFVLPTYLHIKNPERELYSLLPFYHADESKQRNLRFIFPSYFSVISGDDATMTGLLPFYLAGKSNSDTSFRYVFPTWLEWHREKYNSTWFLPFYTAIDDATDDNIIRYRTVLWPFYYHHTDEKEGSATTSVLLNFFYRRTSTSASERYTSILWPLISIGESPQYRLIRIWPYAYERLTEDNFRTHYFLWPLISFGSGDRESSASVLPLFYHRSAPDRSFTVLLPFYLQKRTPERRFSLFFPLWYQGIAGDDTENLLLNTWWSRKGERDSFAFFPLYFRYTTPTESGNLLLNTWWSGGERLERFVFFPLAWYYSPSPEELDFTFFPLFSYDHTGNDSSTFSVLWRLYYQHHDRDGAMSAFLWWLYRTEERPGFQRLMCWPFIDYEKNTGATDEVFTSVLLRLITYERNGEHLRFRLFGLTLYES